MITFAIYDVFTDRPYAGNQLAVVFDGQDLTGAQMQAVAKEFGYSETVFVLPATVAEADYRARIFTPEEELPFAGHPTVGASIAVTRSGRVKARDGKVVQECAAGLMGLQLDGDTAKLTSTVLAVGEPLDVETAAATIGLDPAKVLGRPGRASAGLEHNFVRLADEDVPAASDHLGVLNRIYLFSFDPETHAVHARLFHEGMTEDPATGSAAVALGVHLVAEGLLTGDGVHTYEISQGTEIGRPSRLLGEVVVENGEVVAASVTGSAVQTAEGTLTVLP
ncbi:PhzF family phenazine biosynthesis protein [Glycomyces sp. NPDC046736]|uniref:PhzF family phenazine biosynthesis protein n=1 Tax=Glycomyces sp. NPDC046736 TaxID=3155615 RepID=UPI0033EF8F3A